MALQLLKRNYTMPGYEQPKILKLPQGEIRWAPRRLPVDVGDVMMNIRMDDSKNKYIGEHVSKFSQGNNPYGEWGYPYKINKNNIRPPIIDPKYYEALSRMPVKFDSVTAGPIVKDLYGKRVEITEVAPQTIIDKVCPETTSNLSAPNPNAADKGFEEGSIELHLKQPRASIPYHPSIPVYANTGVPQVELQGQMIVRPQMGIHAPFNVSDQTRDVNNMRTPMHVALQPGYKDPYTFIQPTVGDIQGINENMQHVSAASTPANPIPTIDNLTRDGYDLAPKVQSSAWYNPSYYLTEYNGYRIGDRDQSCLANKVKTATQAPVNYKMIDSGHNDNPIRTRTALNTSRTTNLNSRHLQEAERGAVSLPDAIQAGGFEGKAQIPTIQEHQTFNRTRDTNSKEYFFIENRSQYGEPLMTADRQGSRQNRSQPRQTGIRERLNVQKAPVNRTGLEPPERVIPVGTGRFIHNTF
jgi:hypothetical protein